MTTFVGFSTVNRSKKFTLTDFDLIKQDLINAFNIRQGTLPGRCGTGTAIWNFLFENQIEELQNNINQEIQRMVARQYNVSRADLLSSRRTANVVRPRQVAMYLAKTLTLRSLPEIGRRFGGRDHTTVLHAVRKIGAERQQMSDLNQQLHVLEQTLKG